MEPTLPPELQLFRQELRSLLAQPPVAREMAAIAAAIAVLFETPTVAATVAAIRNARPATDGEDPR
jgi:hypothetical protein